MVRSRAIWSIGRLIAPSTAASAVSNVGTRSLGRAAATMKNELQRAVPGLTGVALGAAQNGVVAQQLPWMPLAARPLSTLNDKSAQAGEKARRPAAYEKSLKVEDEEVFDAITDKMMERPVSTVEATSYGFVIFAAFAFLTGVVYFFVADMIFQSTEQRCFDTALERLRQDPRVTVRLGEPIKGYGSNTRNRYARQQIPHNTYTDTRGREHMVLEFFISGPAMQGVVHADMYRNESGDWEYHSLAAKIGKQLLVLEGVLPGQ